MDHTERPPAGKSVIQYIPDRVYTCIDCGKHFEKRSEILNHVADATHMEGLICYSCRWLFSTREAMAQHSLNKHIDNGKEVRESTTVMTQSNTPSTDNMHPHFWPKYWAKGKTPEKALLTRPFGSYAWTSPALNPNMVLEMLEPKLLNERQRVFMWWPAALAMPDWEEYSEEYSEECSDEYRNDVNIGGPGISAAGFDIWDYPLVLPDPERPTPADADNIINGINNTTARPAQGKKNKKIYKALVIDCEMVELHNKDEDGNAITDLVRITVLDFVTGAALLDALVQPVGNVKCWREGLTGVTPESLRDAKAAQAQERTGDRKEKGKEYNKKKSPMRVLLDGWPEARAFIFSIADSSTILIGHALHNDLKVLRIKAPRIIDTQCLAGDAVFLTAASYFRRQYGLRTLCDKFLNVSIQEQGRPHSPVEDTLATRELLLFWMMEKKKFRAWVKEERVKNWIFVADEEEEETEAEETQESGNDAGTSPSAANIN